MPWLEGGAPRTVPSRSDEWRYVSVAPSCGSAPCERRNGDDDSIDALECTDNSLARFEITRRHLHGMREVFACRRGVSGEDAHRGAIGYETVDDVPAIVPRHQGRALCSVGSSPAPGLSADRPRNAHAHLPQDLRAIPKRDRGRGGCSAVFYIVTSSDPASSQAPACHEKRRR